MEKIHKNILDYILKDVNVTLERLGVSEKVEVVEEKEIRGRYYYNIESKPIKVIPMIYKETIMKGSIMNVCEAEEGKGLCRKGYRLIQVSISYAFKYFGGGQNGVEFGVAYYSVEKDIAEDEAEQLPYMIRKVQSINI
jgi:hypothetical protein